MTSSLALVAKVQRLKALRDKARALRASASSLQSQAEPEALEATPEGFYEFMGRVSPNLEKPRHLQKLVDVLDAAVQPRGPGQRFFWVSIPPRHWKSVTLMHGVAMHLQRWPTENVIYATHTAKFARKQSRTIRRLAIAAGLTISKDVNTQDEWELEGTEAGLVARGVGGEVTGRGARLIVIDDPIKSRKVAESPVEREAIWSWIIDDILSRLTPDGVAILNHTRWHPDDPIGRAQADSDQQWEGENLQALSGPDEDQPLLPEHWPFEVLDRIRKRNAYSWASLYQGKPRPRGGAVFDPPHYYVVGTEPRHGFRVGYGTDLAYSKKTHADWSVLLRFIEHEGRYYITHMLRVQARAKEFRAAASRLVDAMPGPVRWYCSGVEQGVADLMEDDITWLNPMNASADKFLRAQPVAEAWNDGRILVPCDNEETGEEAPDWVDDLVLEVCQFTGVADLHDDIVDALAAGFDELQGGESMSSGSARRRSREV